ncbi:hypothetical protein BDZ89DRAFT_530581 [Hymenopellis radicata]|nr:hypothetical protein BDZ89DRAFT_530581 [Hymenopellis radicata]
MGVHHPIVQRPLDLKPVKKLASLAPDAVDDLVSRFINASTSSKDRQNILFFRAPGRIVWCNEPHSNGYLYAAMHQLSVSERGLHWNTKTRPLQALYNQEMELMILDDRDTIWYSGRYKLHKLHSFIPGGCSDLTTLSQHDLAKNTLHLEGKVPDSRYHQAMAFVSRLWTSPFMKAEVLGMQCVGFNDELYRSLRAKAETWNWKVPTPIKEPGGRENEDHRPWKRQRT